MVATKLAQKNRYSYVPQLDDFRKTYCVIKSFEDLPNHCYQGVDGLYEALCELVDFASDTFTPTSRFHMVARRIISGIAF